MNRKELEKYISEIYGAAPEYPWSSAPGYGVFRHPDNRKWFAVIMDIPREKVEPDTEGIIDVVNLKCDPVLIGSVRNEEGIFPGYHMNKNHWITITLDGRVEAETVKWLLNLSFDLTAKKKK